MADEPTRLQLVEQYRAEHAWRTDHYKTAMFGSVTQSAEFARELIRALLLLHGGTLVGLPPLLHLLGVEFAEHRPELADITIGSAVGLIATVLATVAAYAVTTYAAHNARDEWDAAQHDAWESVYENFGMTAGASKAKTAAAAADQTARNSRKLMVGFTIVGTLLAAVGVGALIRVAWVSSKLVLAL